MITLHQIQKKYYDSLIISVPKLELPHGIYWMQGGNGAGKTTCLKIIAGLIPFEGDVLVKSTISSKRQPVQYRQMVSYAEAEPLYPAFLTGRDLLQLHTGARGEGYESITELSALLGIPAFIHNPVSSYSSGMLKKLSLLLAFTGRPALILLDEPLITLDTATIPILYDWIRRFHTQHGVSFVITSHQLITAGELQLTATLVIDNKELKKV
ncbi:ATP-binding cassette domain-containing protein [Chitinophaga agrisoli]|uniref:ATP-binding cassette domain-containing protein n=1 Tax=Chitinophaga agrisoli TaxID=2607653 RepID=A0A5B2VUQ9_9BACT|nr:ATP-binding cassette domain-containing protein [Chitinophaga agrisoli]KAA2241926.1 ATP-binding cassette domain-containing protein [Chitinophaga agrisoli]